MEDRIILTGGQAASCLQTPNHGRGIFLAEADRIKELANDNERLLDLVSAEINDARCDLLKISSEYKLKA